MYGEHKYDLGAVGKLDIKDEGFEFFSGSNFSTENWNRTSKHQRVVQT